MKKLTLVGVKACAQCHSAVAYLKTEGGEETLHIRLDACQAMELSRTSRSQGQEKFLTDILLELCSCSSYVPREIILDVSEQGIIAGRVNVTTETFICSPQDALVLAIRGSVPLYVTERVFEHRDLCAAESAGENEVTQRSPKPTVH